VIRTIPFIILAMIVACIVAVGLAIEESEAHALAMLLGLPFLAGLYVAGLQVIPGAGSSVGLVMLLLGLLILGSATLAAQKTPYDQKGPAKVQERVP
jgi:hypothetical protein